MIEQVAQQEAALEEQKARQREECKQDLRQAIIDALGADLRAIPGSGHRGDGLVMMIT